jgi:dihydroxyacid dehydratase/phosphogluconate dehydratase
MLHLQRAGLLHTDVITATGRILAENLDWWEKSERRIRFQQLLRERDGIDADEVIFSPEAARAKNVMNTLVFPRGNLAPDGSVVKSTAIDPGLLNKDGVYRKEGPARFFASERAAMTSIKSGEIRAGDVLVLAGIGPMGTGMEETYQVTGALKHPAFGKDVALLTDARFSGVSTGACIGHIGPEGLAGGPIGKIQDGDWIRIEIDCRRLDGTVDLIGEGQKRFSPEDGARVLAGRKQREDLAPDPRLPEDTKLWAALQLASGGTWAGCVYDVEKIGAKLRNGRKG